MMEAWFFIEWLVQGPKELLLAESTLPPTAFHVLKQHYARGEVHKQES